MFSDFLQIKYLNSKDHGHHNNYYKRDAERERERDFNVLMRIIKEAGNISAPLVIFIGNISALLLIFISNIRDI